MNTASLSEYIKSMRKEHGLTQVVRNQTTLTGVQAKLSLNIEKTKGEPQRFTIVGLWGRYILKPQTEQFKHLPGWRT